MRDDILTEDEASSALKARGEVEGRRLLCPSGDVVEFSGLIKVETRSASKRAGVRVPSSRPASLSKEALRAAGDGVKRSVSSSCAVLLRSSVRDESCAELSVTVRSGQYVLCYSHVINIPIEAPQCLQMRVGGSGEGAGSSSPPSLSDGSSPGGGGGPAAVAAP